MSAQLPEQATVVSLPMDDPEAAVRSPALASLLAAGWTPLAALPAQRGERSELLLFLAPPRAQPALHVPRTLYLLAFASTAIGAAVGELLAYLLTGAHL